MGLKNVLNYFSKIDASLPHFNFSSIEQLEGIVNGCLKTRSPIFVALSESEAEFVGYELARKAVDYYRHKYNWVIFLNADHHKSLITARKAIEAGFDGVHIDLSEHSLDYNINLTKKVVQLAQTHNQSISVEGELGKIGDGNYNHQNLVKSFTEITDVYQYLKETGVDRLAVAVGSNHGMDKKIANLDLELLKKISLRLIPETNLTLHGASGVLDSQLKMALKYFSNIHYNTELRIAFKKGLEKGLSRSTVKPYEYFELAIDEVEKTVEDRVRLLKSNNKEDIIKELI
ncbi:hypothetical protein COZ61_02375 [Candidatus Berkelbacteria bacterium CG_4_8_14_3_um_filter_33_6]|uniref:Tagatose-bisphosphate aldolase n=2 Tax=Bacteria candidate phyla TaxID=1783234 RepID=A0A2M7XN48_9BACT|nr:MAG: hypothetical protein COX10_01405 [Candidatus Berkelbacteria bacterium CG23_combo_of_CG06-09_8_20_14_all_33_15]PIX30950.1 MAG: hypothetical protein COZ61_02375 [Candidatus Berkelbacteria bacterium CG_4_8_14_3_um_filter_33_6]PIZ28096.1 MAG: hypothetical protein COY43_02295 [Candidatus Berkelbacteria bacterium CG_4_10_14_0_8_um_filter_35_9_33_8]PJA20502.1 MAG: hypothetical protein COX60_01420 [Candidatus Berkelbacteria bacterium CG_4_10_14_0_2_um_filter_35_9_33_12]PJA50995.1 MAG: hypotheti